MSYEKLTQNDEVFFGKVIDWDQTYKSLHSTKYVSYDFLKEYPMSSPYTLRWEPTDELEVWASNIKTSSLKTVPYGKDVCFVHVGKAAGSSIGSLLGFRLHNKDLMYKIPDGKLPTYTTHLIHNGVNDCADDSPYYLWNVRSPLQRIRSAFPYDRDKHSKQEIYRKCFDDLNTLGEALDMRSTTSSEYCQARAFEFVTGLDKGAGHTFFNLRRYYYEAFRRAQKLQDSQILVLRVEHLENDYYSVERVVSEGVSEEVHLEIPHANKKEKDEEDNYLSNLAIEKLCAALCPEIQIYKYLLRVAVNLDEGDYKQSVMELGKECPNEAFVDLCPFFDHRSVKI